MLDTLSTDPLEPGRRFAFWSEVVCRTFTMLDCRVADWTDFRARLCSRSVAGISVARVEATPSGVVRTAGLIRSSHDDSHIVMLQISGSTRDPARRAVPSDVSGSVRRRAGGQALRSEFPARVFPICDQVAPRHCSRLAARSARRRHGSSDPLLAICLIRTSSLMASATKSQPGPCRTCYAGVRPNRHCRIACPTFTVWRSP